MTDIDNEKAIFPIKKDNLTTYRKNSNNKNGLDKNQELDADFQKEKLKSTNIVKSKQNIITKKTILKNPIANPIWLSISEAAKLGGVNTKTIRRAIQSEKIKYKIFKNRYLIGLRSLILYLNTNTKLKNKLKFNGIGQYIKNWRK